MWLFPPSALAATVFQVGLDPNYPTVDSAVDDAVDGDTIEIHGPATYTEATDVNNLDLTIVGVDDPVLQGTHGTNGFVHLHGDSVVSLSGVTFDGRGGYRAFKVSGSAAVTFSDSVVSDTSSTNGAGAVFVDNSASLTMVGVTFSVSSSSASGGFVLAQGSGPFVARACSFTSGAASTAGGAIHCKTTGGCTIEGSTFSTNFAGDGGALLLEQGPLTVTGSRFCGNVASNTGGAILANGALTVDHSVFGVNVASVLGGAINSTGALTLSHDDFLANSGGAGSAIGLNGTGAFSSRHDLFVDHPGAFAVQTNGNPNVTLAWALFDGNVGTTPIGAGTDAVFGAPLFTDWDGVDCLGATLTLEPGSAAIDAGDPAEPDPDGSAADIGAFGPACSPTGVELPGDGIDADCDGSEQCYVDADGDGNGEPGATVPGPLDCSSPGLSPDADDLCVGFSDLDDLDGDSVPDGCDICPKGNDLYDFDGDTIPDDCDPNPLGLPTGDTGGGGPGDTGGGTGGTGGGDTTDPPTSGPGEDELPPVRVGGAAPDSQIGCGCATPAAGASWGAWVGVALFASRRRRLVPR